MARASFWGTTKIAGTVKGNRPEKASSAALVVEAWDTSEHGDDFLGYAAANERGEFEIEFDRMYARDRPEGYRPEVTFSVFDGDDYLFTTPEPVRAGSGQPLKAFIDLSVGLPDLFYRCRPRNIYLKIEKVLGYSPADPDPDAHGMYRKDCMHGEGHDAGVIPDAEINQRMLDAIVYREYLDAAYSMPKTTKMVTADLKEPTWFRRVPGAVLYLRPGRRVRIHVLNGDDRPHSLHVHGLAYGVDSDGSFPLGVANAAGERSDEICPGGKWIYEFDVTEEMIGCWPFHSHVHHVQDVTDLGLFGGIVVRNPRIRHPDIEVPFFIHHMRGPRAGSAFDSGNLAVGAAFAYTFPAAGTFSYTCRFHPMNGVVNVIAGAASSAAVAIRDGPARFDPPSVTVAPGGTVTWTNAGIQLHTVTESGGAGSLDSACINGRTFLGNTPLVEAKSGQRIRWYVFNLDFSSNWHNFHAHGQRWRWHSEVVDTRTIGPAESFVADTRVPNVVLAPCRERKPDVRQLKDRHFCGDFLVHCHVEHHMMQGMVAAVRAQQHLALTDVEFEQLRFAPNHYCMPGDHGGHGECPHVSHSRCASGPGRWDPLPNTPIFAVHAAVLRTGNVLFWSGTAEVGYATQSYLFNPAANTYVGPQAYGEDLFCSGHTFLADGRLLVAGGAPQFFLKSTHVFDPGTSTWTKLAGHDMNHGRWYPTLVPLSDGRVLAVSGRNGTQPIEIFDPAAQSWTIVAGGDKEFSQLYPSLNLLPTGQVFYSRTGWNPQGGTQSARLDFTGPASGAWTDHSPMTFPDRQEGASVILVDDTVTPPNVRVIVFGGGVSGAFNKQSCEMIDVTSLAPTPTWVRMADMHFPRTNVTGVLLPDGKVLAIGGQRNGKWAANPAPVFEAELFDPAANSWTALAPMTSPRQYHSVAVLLPDGRVFVAGGIDPTLGAAPARDLRTAEIFSPPYLSAGARPVISTFPANAAYGAEVVIGTPDAASIASVVIMRPAALTHHTDAGQRHVRLRKTVAGPTSIGVRMPLNGTVAPPGFYMLFLVNSSGVPSTAEWIQLQ